MAKYMNKEGCPRRQQVLVRFASTCVLYRGTTESMVFHMFDSSIFPKVSCKGCLDHVAVTFIHGDRDWVDSTGAEVLITSKQR